jgi:PPK2 family polyphosphate:nucleotide phosphotransferase
MKFADKLVVRHGHKVNLSKWDPEDTLGYKKDHKLQSRLEKAIERIDDFQYRLYAENKRAVLVVLQGIDASGKDGTIRHVMSGLNPQGCRVTAFKVPSPEEAQHDFLWRVHNAVPPKGDVGIFNRSHYEEVLTVRVHNLVPKSVWSKRYDEINEFESYLTENDIRVIKFFLYISKDEQKKRFQERIDDPRKQWKISEADFKEREFWDDYMRAYEAMLSKCSPKSAPWYIVPANKRWFRNLAVSHILAETLEEMDPKFPKAQIDVSKLKWK